MSKESSPNGTAQDSTNGADETSQTTKEPNADTSNGGAKDSVSYESYRKVVGAHKNMQEKFSLLESELRTLKEDKLMSEGKKDEVMESLRTKNKELESKLQTSIGNFAYKAVSGEVAKEAMKLGCVDADALIQLVDLGELDVSDDFMVDAEQVKTMLEDVKKKRPYLFQKEAPKFIDGKPQSGDLKQKDWKKSTLNEKLELFKKF